MQKKYFSLLATAPIVFTAAAHENVPFSNLLKVDPGNDNWIYGGVTSTTNGDNTVYIETASSVGTITLDVLKAYRDANNENLPKGDYKIDFGVFMGDKDGIGVKPPKLLVNGEVVDNGYIFNYNGKGKFEIGVQSGGEAASFTFGDGKLTLQCNFEAIANSLQNSLNDVTYTELTEQNPASEEYTALQGERNTLEEERAGIQSEINEISANDKDDDYYIGIYSKYELWNGEKNNTVVPEIQAFAERVNQYNEEVTAENDRYQQQLDNQATYNSMNEAISTLETNVNELKGKITDNEYIIGLIGEDLETILSQITSYKYDLYVTFHTDGAIKDGEIDTETLETRYAKLEEDYNTANETYNKASSDQTAYAEWDKLYHDLIAAQNKANSTFAETAKNNVYEDWKEEYTNKVDDIATKAIDTCGIKEGVIADAADHIEADEKTINEAIEKINSDLEEFETKVKEQDGFKATADDVLGDLQNQLDEQVIPGNIPDTVKKELGDQKKAIQDKIDGKRTSIEELYQAHGLNKANANLYTFKDLIEGSISDLSKAIEKAKDDAEEYQKINEANDSFVEVVTTKFEVLKDLIKETFPEGTELYGKFDPSIDNMESDINAFKKDVDEMTQKGIDVDGSVNHEEYIEFTDWQYNLLKNIDEVSKIVTSVAADYEAIKDNLKTMQGEVDNFQNAYDGKEVVMDGDTPLVDKEQILGNALSGLQKTIGDFETGLKEVSGESNLILQQQIASLKTEVEGRVETFKDDVESAILAFSKAVTEENNKVAQKERTAALAAASAFENPTEIPGGTEMLTDFNALVKEGTDLQNSLSKAESAENYDALDPDCQSLYDHAKALNDYADKLKANNDAYSTLTTEAAAVQAEIDTVREWLDANTQENAKSFYNGKLDVLQSQLDAINEQIETAYKEIKLKDNSDVIKNELLVIMQDASTVNSDAESNEVYHNAQCSDFNSLTSRYEYVKDYIKTNDQLEDDRETRLAELEVQKARIDTLETTIATAYDNGESKAKDTEIDDTYQDILDAINVIFNSMQDEYAQKVIENNNYVLDNSRFDGMTWDGWYSELDKEYNEAVRTYERYHNSLLNAGYKTFVGDILENHNDIIKYIAEIRQLKIDVKEYIDELNNKAEVLTEETLKEIAIDPAQQIIDKINAAVDEMKSAFNEKAQEYWESNYDDKLTQLTAIITSLRDAGVNESIIKEYTRDVSDELEQARLLYNAHKDGDLSPWMGAQIVDGKIVAGGIADMLDDINVSNIDTEGAANAQWTVDLTEAEQTLQTYRDNLDSYGRLSDEEKAGYTAQYDEIQNRINELDEEAKSSEDLLENLRDFADELNSIMDDATAIDTEAKALQDGREGEQAAHDGFVADLESASQRLEALRDWVDGMAIEYDNDFSPISREIENLRTKVENSDLTSSEVKDEITNDITELNSMIDSAYQNCYDQEKAALNNLLTLSELALNRYKAENEFTSDEVAEYYSRIDKVKNDINALSDDLTIIDSEEVRTELLGLQNTLVKLISDIEEARRNLHPDITNPLQDALNALNSRYEEINSTLAGLLNGKTESVAEEYQSQVEALENELNDVKAAYENEGNNLFATESTYNNALDKISAKAAELQKAINDAQAAYEQELERQAASDAAAANLQQQIDGFRSELNSLKSFVEGAGMYPNVEFEFNNLVAYAEGRINAMQTWLDEEKEKYALTSESVLPNAATLTDFLNQATGMYVIMESGYQVDRARTAVDQTALLVVGQKHNNQEELDAKLAALEARVNDLKAASTVEAVAALTEEVNSIVEAAKALADEAIENAFIVGDINGDGKVTAVDLQALLNIIKEEEITPDDSRFNTLNINKDDAVDVVDAVALANMIIGESAEQVRARIMARPAENPTVAIQAVETEADNGTRTILIDLTNSVDFVAGQFDLKLPAGMQILSEDLTDRTDGMMLLTNSLPDGRYRVILFSEQLSDMEGNEGSILELKVVGNGNIYVNNAVFGDRFGHTYAGTDPGTTGIDGILNSAKDGAQKIYDAAGRMVNKIQKGINVIVNGKGKGKKVIGRK